MKNKIWIYLFIALPIASSCSMDSNSSIVYINSYHQGYPLSDDIQAEIVKEFSGKGDKLDIFYLDSKNEPSDSSVEVKAAETYREIKKIKPDIIILSDDNAVKFFGKVYQDSLKVPFVFCGVNWDHRVYELPSGQFTGILEIIPVRECIDLLKKGYPNAQTLGILSENSFSERKNQVYLNTITGLKNEYRLADNFQQWKSMFLELNRKCDFIFIPTNGGVKNWDDKAAAAFVRKNIKVPVFTCDDFMMNYAVFGMIKTSSEQGEWAARNARLILKGKKVKNIPVARNMSFKLLVNRNLSEKINLDTSEWGNASDYIPE